MVHGTSMGTPSGKLPEPPTSFPVDIGGNAHEFRLWHLDEITALCWHSCVWLVLRSFEHSPRRVSMHLTAVSMPTHAC
jgi:hypothetical protein